MARPIPCPAAVTSASLFCKRNGIIAVSVPDQLTDFRRFGSCVAAATGFLLARHLGSESMIIPRDVGLRDAMIFYGRREHHAAGELVDHAALHFLPRRLAWRVFVATRLLQLDTAPCKLGFRDQDVGSAVVEIDPNTIAGLEQSKSAASRGFGRSVDDRWRGRGADWRPSPMQGSDVIPRLISAPGGCMLTTSAEPG